MFTSIKNIKNKLTGRTVFGKCYEIRYKRDDLWRLLLCHELELFDYQKQAIINYKEWIMSCDFVIFKIIVHHNELFCFGYNSLLIL